MQKLLREYLDDLNKKQKKSRKAAVAALLLVVLVVGSVAGILAQYGVAMTGTEKCGLEEHAHGAECYTKTLSCGLSEGEGHTHTDACLYPAELVCGLEENEAHAHTDACYARPEGFACGLEEGGGHVHTDACYTEELTCGKEEHVHTDACYIDVEADVEEQTAWDNQYAGTEWKGAWGEDLVTAARAQLGYKESVNNYAVAEDGSHKGYTRYGQFVGDVYADWDAAFVNFCLHYAGLRDSGLFPAATDAAAWQEEFRNAGGANGAYLAEAGYAPAAGDLVFFRREGEETETQMGIVSSCEEAGGVIHVIEGNSQNEVRENVYDANDGRVTGFLKITELETAYKAAAGEENGETGPAKEDESQAETGETENVGAEEGMEALPARTMSVEGGDYTVTVSFTEEAEIPEETVLEVREIEKGSEEYQEYYERSLEAMGVEKLGFARYFDVTFRMPSGENGEEGIEIEPAAPVDVKISYADTVELAGTERGNAVHFAENKEDGTKNPEVLEAGFDAEEKSFSFTQNSFSVTGTVEAPVLNETVGTVQAQDGGEQAQAGEKYYAVKLEQTEMDLVNGKEFLVSADAGDTRHFLTSQAVDDGLKGVSLTRERDGSVQKGSAQTWRFVQFNSMIYQIQSEEGKYLAIENNKLVLVAQPGNNAYFFLSIDGNGNILANHASGGVSLSNVAGDGERNFCRADLSVPLTLHNLTGKVKTETLTPVPSLDTSGKLSIRMIDYDRPGFGGYAWGDSPVGGVKQGILSKKTAEKRGYPAFVEQGGSLESLFAGATNANYLFQKDEDGYYYYDCTKNAASFNASAGIFTLYGEQTTIAKDDTGKATKAAKYRGNFLPYNTFYKGTRSYLTTQYDISGNALSPSSGEYGKTLYYPDEEPNYYFGMEISADFYQAQNGLVNGKPMRYEFNGDDDLWVYIDGVLVLDMGGCHEAQSGWIDFSTGRVVVEGITANQYVNGLTANVPGHETSLYECFKAAGAESTVEWKTLANGSKVFADNSQHTFQMWYMERGAGASSLKVKFNFPVIPMGDVQIEKKLSNTEQEKYANVDFAFQVYLQPADGDGIVRPNEPTTFVDVEPGKYELLDKELSEKQKTTAEVEVIRANGVPREGDAEIPENGIFWLKPGDKLILHELTTNRKYFVREIGINQEAYSKAIIDRTEESYLSNDGSIWGQDILAGADIGYVETTPGTVKDKAFVTFTNACSDKNSNELRITKQKTGTLPAGATFAYRVWIESQSEGVGTEGKLVPYAGKYYLNGNATSYELTETDNGVISGISVGDTVIIKGLLAGTAFYVEETGLSDEYNAPAIGLEEGTCDPPAALNSGKTAQGQIKLGSNALMTVTNSLKKEPEPEETYTWKIIKKSSTRDGRVLEGAVFALETDSAKNPLEIYYGKSNADGEVEWFTDRGCTDDKKLQESIGEGSYTLKEVEAPSGYVLSAEIWNLTIKEDGDIEVSGCSRPEGEVIQKETSGTATTVTLTFYNDVELYELPSTGGIGTTWYLIGGTLLMLAAALILYKNKRGEVLGS